MSDQPKKNKFTDYPCPVCQGEDFSWGRLRSPDFIPDSGNILAKFGGKIVRIRKCNRCGNLQMFSY